MQLVFFLESDSIEQPYEELHKFVALWIDELNPQNVELGNTIEMMWSWVMFVHEGDLNCRFVWEAVEVQSMFQTAVSLGQPCRINLDQISGELKFSEILGQVRERGCHWRLLIYLEQELLQKQSDKEFLKHASKYLNGFVMQRGLQIVSTYFGDSYWSCLNFYHKSWIIFDW